MEYVLAVDGGNAKTVALVARKDGTILGSGRGGYADIYGVESPDTALAQIVVAVSGACEAAGIDPAEIVVGAFSLAGADWPEDYELLHQELLSRHLARRVLIYHDSFGALRTGSPDLTGVAVVWGLGTAIGARGVNGQAWCGGFWQADGTGAGDLGTAAMRLVLRAELGIDPHTSLTARLLEWHQAGTVEELLHKLTRRGAPRPTLADLAPILLEACEQGDRAAKLVVETCAKTVGDYVLAAARMVGLGASEFPLVLAGGVLGTHTTTLVETTIDRVRARNPLVAPILAPYAPVVGTMFLALEGAGIVVDAHIEANARASAPPSASLATYP